MIAKIIKWALIIFVPIFIITKPDSAAVVVKWLGGKLMFVAQGFGDFFTSLIA